MSTIGIGDLKYAKKTLKGDAPKNAAIPVTTSKPDLKRESQEKPKEGQLSVDIYQTDDKMIIVCPIAGVKKSEINVAIQDDVLTIRGERKMVKEMNDRTPLVNELFWGVFSRSIVLPDHIDRKNISARVENHMLVVSIPKTEDFKTRIIHINDSE
ncbi:MAG: Hsp20/alpha crystallin family protein [Patescibacteria group bacterium]